MSNKNSSNFPELFAEMSMAAPQVIAHRLTRMALAGPNLSARDQKEFQQMGTEKVMAFYESWQAMTLQAMYFNQKLMFDMMTAMWFPWTANKTLQNLPNQVNKATNEMLEQGIKPIHHRAVANAKRLNKTKLK